MALLYRHIRLDKNEVFYVGIGTSEKRAYSKRNRSKHWLNIASKGYSVEIILDDLTWIEACAKEQEFINLYGRSDLGKGTLCNYTDGGEGSVNLKHTAATKKLLSKLKKGKPVSEASLKALESSRKSGTDHHMKQKKYREILQELKQKSVTQYDIKGNLIQFWSSITEASSVLKIDNSSIGKACMGKLKSAGSYRWLYTNK